MTREKSDVRMRETKTIDQRINNLVDSGEDEKKKKTLFSMK